MGDFSISGCRELGHLINHKTSTPAKNRHNAGARLFLNLTYFFPRLGRLMIERM